MINEIKHVHVKDYKFYAPNTAPEGIKTYPSVGGTLIQPVDLGKGSIDIEYCLNLLKKSNYQGAIALEGEFSTVDDILPDLEYMRSHSI